LDTEAEPGEENSFSIQALIEAVRDDTGYGMEIRAEGTIEAETRFQNIEEIISKAADYQAHSDAPKLGEFLEDVSLVADIDRKDDTQDLLTMMTLHGAKGLEFPKVYLVGMNDGLFPGYAAIGNSEELEEERRLCYVGITRAREELVMTSARSRMMNGSYERMKTSTFIDEIPDQLCVKTLLQGYGADPFADDDYGDSDIFGGGARRFGAKSGRGADAYSGGKRYGSGSSSYGYGNAAGGLGGASSSFGANRYGLTGMGSAGYATSKSGSATRKKGAGIPQSLLQTGIQKLEHLDYAVGDRVKHIKFGEGTVEAIEDGKKDYTVTVQFDKGGQKKMLASFAKLQKLQE
ncbi:MAG TPA: ATP-dependent DNA helicase PcrA, partial [Oribacterium sp.]|nr:ATP-dependent DNA helicase PcrA [Oribacterium sp.]